MTESERKQHAADLEQLIGDFLRERGFSMSSTMCRRVETESHIIMDLAKKKELKPIEADSVWNEVLRRTFAS